MRSDAHVSALFSAIILVGGCAGSGSRVPLRAPTDGFSITVYPGERGRTSFGALVTCAKEAGVQVTRVRAGTAHGRIRLETWGHRPNPTMVGDDMLGAESETLTELGFDVTAPVAVGSICGPDGYTRDGDTRSQEIGVQLVSTDTGPASIENLLLDWASTPSGARGTIRIPWTLVLCGSRPTPEGVALGCVRRT